MIGAGISALFKNKNEEQPAAEQNDTGEAKEQPKSLTLSEPEVQADIKPAAAPAADGEFEAPAPPVAEVEPEVKIEAAEGELNFLLSVYPQATGFEDHVAKLAAFISAQGIDEAVAKKRAGLIVTQARAIDLDPALLGSVIFVFSKFNEQTSQNGRFGLMFLSQKQAEEICKRELVVCESESALLREDYNLFLGSLELSSLAKKYSGELPMVISAYLFGESSDLGAAAASQEIKDLVTLITSSVDQIRLADVSKKVAENATPAPSAKPEKVIEKEPSKEDSGELNPKSFMTMSIDLSGRDVAEVERMLDLIQREAEKNKLDPLLVGAIAWNISGLNPNLQGSDGRQGLMQLDPAQGAYMAGLVEKEWQPEKLMEPDYNIELASSYFALLMEIFEGNMLGALTAYHWDVKKFTAAADAPERVPPSSSNFARQVIATYDTWSKEYQVFSMR